MKQLLPLLALLLLAGCRHQTATSPEREVIDVEAPFPMPSLVVPSFRPVDYVITDYGAKADTTTVCTDAIARAIEACCDAGGGRVVIPAGTWVTGPIHLRSHVNLHLADSAVVVFTDNPADYLPPVQVSWEGMECMNYSPLIYAFDCEDIAITGGGMIMPRMDFWRTWFTRPEGHLEASKRLYHWAATDYPVEQRDMTALGDEHMRPHLIHLNRCRNVLLDGFTIRESPFWTIHLLLCRNVVARHLDVRAHGHNNDGIDLEMTRDVLVEDCVFDQGDDAVVIKSGRNRDAWRLHTPTENVVVRNCTVRKGHTLLGIGSEMSGGVRNIYMHHMQCPDNILRLFFLKTNHRRGGFIENVTLEDVACNNVLRVMEIDTDVLYQWRDIVPTYDTIYTRIDSIAMRRIECQTADAVYELKGDAHEPIGTVIIDSVHVGHVADFISKATNVRNIVENALTVDEECTFDPATLSRDVLLNEGGKLTVEEMKPFLNDAWTLSGGVLSCTKRGAKFAMPFFGSNVFIGSADPTQGRLRLLVKDEWGNVVDDVTGTFDKPDYVKLFTPRRIIANYTLELECVEPPIYVDDIIVIWK